MVVWALAATCWVFPLTVLAAPALVGLWVHGRSRAPYPLLPLLLGLAGTANIVMALTATGVYSR